MQQKDEVKPKFHTPVLKEKIGRNFQISDKEDCKSIRQK